jgi:hypothetical protein
MWIEYNPNPFGKRVGDCVVRAISKALNKPWGCVFIELCVQGFMMGDMPSSNAIWSSYLKNRGFKRHTVEDCPECYTIEDFCREHPNGVYVIGTGSHAVCVCDGCVFDAWNSLQESPVYFFEKENK